MWLAFASAGASAAPTVVVQPPDLQTLRIEAPRFDLDPNLPPSRCIVRVEIDEGGVPIDTEGRGCPPKFVGLAEAAVDAWRWAPPEFDGQRVGALTWVAVEFTGRGRIPVAAADRCTYALRITADGRVAPTGTLAPQCAIWPAQTLHGTIPAAETCTVSIDAGIQRDTPGWVVLDDCPEAAREVASVIAAGSLFVEGTASTRLVITLPSPASAPTSVGLEVRGPVVAGPPAGGRLGEAPVAPEALDPSLAVPDGTTAPNVDFAELMRRKKAEKPPTPPADESADD